MRIAIDDVPRDVLRAARLGAWIESRSPLPQYEVRGEARLTRPMERWRSDIAAAVTNNALVSARRVGWRSFVFGNDSVFCVDIGERKGEAVLSGVSHGDYVKSMVDALIQVEERDSEDEVRVRFFTIPDIFFRGLWIIGNGFEEVLESDHRRKGRLEFKQPFEIVPELAGRARARVAAPVSRARRRAL